MSINTLEKNKIAHTKRHKCPAILFIKINFEGKLFLLRTKKEIRKWLHLNGKSK